MSRSAVRRWNAARPVAVLGALALAVRAEAMAGASVQPAWLWPALIAVAVVGLAIFALRGAASEERAIVGKGESTNSESTIFVVTRETMQRRRTDTAPASELRPSREAPGFAPVTPDRVLRGLSARMDEVRYQAGAPNVLSMTKRREAGDGAGAGARLDRRDDGDATVVSIVGALDAITEAEVVPALEAIAGEGRRTLTLELSALSYLDAAGASALVRVAARCREHGGVLRVAGLTRQPRALFQLLRLERALAS